MIGAILALGTAVVAAASEMDKNEADVTRERIIAENARRQAEIDLEKEKRKNKHETGTIILNGIFDLLKETNSNRKEY
ncbi:MAG: hypothetical protein K6G85_00445 [Eubacterium sp.]|nr:hypothetical protein [Eubacterium sp.]